MKYIPLLGLIFVLSNCATNKAGILSFVPPDADLVWKGDSLFLPENPLFRFVGAEQSSVPSIKIWWEEFDLSLQPSVILVRISYQDPIWFSVGKVDSPPDSHSVNQPSVYQKIEVYQSDRPSGLYYAHLDGYLIVSDQAIGVEKAIFQYQKGADWFPLSNQIMEDAAWIWTQNVPGTENTSSAFWQMSGTIGGENWSFRGWPTEDLFLLPEVSALDILEYSLFACDSIFPLPRTSYWDTGWEINSEFGAYLVFPRNNFSTEGFDVLKESPYLQFSFQQLLIPITSQLGEDPWLLELEDYWILHRESSGLQLLVDAMLQSGVLSSDNGVLQLAELLGDGANFMSFEQNPLFQRLIGFEEGRLVGGLRLKAQVLPIQITHRYLCEGDAVRSLFHLETSGNDRFLIQDESGQLAFTNEQLELIWQIQEEEVLLWAWIIPGLSSRDVDQILYQTKTAVHLLGLEGESVLERPWNIPGGAMHSGTVVRFAERSQSNIFLPSADGRIYAFDIMGVPIQGWEDGEETTEPLLFPMQHFAWEGGDYIFSIDTTGSLFVFNRFGDLRFQPVKGEQGTTPSYYLTESVQRILWAEDNGKIRVVNLLGESFRLDVGAIPPVHQFTLWEDNGELVYEVMDGNYLIEATYKGNDFSVRQRSSVPVGATEVVRSSQGTSILGYWLERPRKFLIVPAEETIPLSFSPVIIEKENVHLLIGAFENEVRIYQVERVIGYE